MKCYCTENRIGNCFTVLAVAMYSAICEICYITYICRFQVDTCSKIISLRGNVCFNYSTITAPYTLLENLFRI